MKGCDFIISQFEKTAEKKKYYNNSLAENNVLKTNTTLNQFEPQKTTNNRNSNLLSYYQPKAFKSSYINDNGKWTQKAVDDGFVKFDDYITDIKSDTSNYISFNNKPLKITNSNDVYFEEILGSNGEPERYAFLDTLGKWGNQAIDSARKLKDKVEKSKTPVDNYIYDGQKEVQRKI